MPRRVLALALTVALVGLSLGQPPAKPLRIGFVASGPGTYWKVVAAGARKASDEARAEFVLVQPEEEQRPDQQAKLIDDLVADRIDGLAISLVDFQKQKAHMTKIGKTLPLGFFNCDLPDTGRAMAVASDHKSGGRLAAQMVREVLPKGGVVAVFTGSSQAYFSKERFKILCGELGIADPEKDLKSKDEKFRLLFREPLQDNSDAVQTLNNVRAALARLKDDIKDEPNVCLVGLWGHHGKAMLDVVKEQNLTGKVAIIAFEEFGETLQGVDDGHIHATITQDAQAMAYKVTQAVLAKARKEAVQAPRGGLEWVPHRIITRTGGKDRLKASDVIADLMKILAP